MEGAVRIQGHEPTNSLSLCLTLSAGDEEAVRNQQVAQHDLSSCSVWSSADKEDVSGVGEKGHAHG